MGYLLGIDMGHSCVKAALVDYENGKVFFEKEEIKGYKIEGPVYENDVCMYIKAIRTDMEKLKSRLGACEFKVDAVSFSTAGESVILADKNGEPMTKVIMGLDSRANSQCGSIADRFSAQDIYMWSGQPAVDPVWPACKMLWLKENMPDIFFKAGYFMLLEDYIIFRLTGMTVCEHSMAATTLYYDMGNGIWNEKMLNYLGIDEERLPRIRNSASVVGYVTKEAAAIFDLEPDTPIVTGAYDQVCGAIGAGNIRPGIVTETTGSVLALGTIAEGHAPGKKMSIPCIPFLSADVRFLLPWEKAGGNIYRWFRDNFCEMENSKAEKTGADTYKLIDAMAAEAAAGSNGLIMLPQFSGSICPDNNPDAVGILYGLNMSTTRASMARSILESVAYVLRSNIELIKSNGIPVREIYSMGGGARSDLWCQIKADVTGIPLSTFVYEETAALGAAILAGLAIARYSSLNEATAKLVLKSKKYYPDTNNHMVYDSLYKKYKMIYSCMEPVFRS